MRRIHQLVLSVLTLIFAMPLRGLAFNVDSLREEAMKPLDLPAVSLLPDTLVTPPAVPDTAYMSSLTPWSSRGSRVSIYDMPYSLSGRSYNWPRLWINTGVLLGAFGGTLLVLECLPEDATSWNRAELRNVPLGRRWHDHVIKEGPEWDHDKFVFNYVLHPYAGAVYYMSARSCGFNAWQSLLYCSLISNVGWEYGIEAFMERPSYQDLIITPLVGSLIGEGFYKAKRYLVEHDYRLFGSPVLGNIVAFLVDPVNEVVGLFAGNDARRVARRKSAAAPAMSMMPVVTPQFKGVTFTATF